MKHVTSILLITSTFIAAEIRGQGFTYLSNTNQPVTGSSLTGSFGIGFTTGTNSLGYQLDSLTLLFANNSTPALVSAGLDDYSTVTYFGGAVEVGAAGAYTFTPSSPLTLGADTSYALLVYPDDAQVDVNVSYTTSTAFSSVDNWNIPGLDGSDDPLFAITASPIEPTPEPSVASLACVGIFAFIVFRVTKRHDFFIKGSVPSNVGHQNKLLFGQTPEGVAADVLLHGKPPGAGIGEFREVFPIVAAINDAGVHEGGGTQDRCPAGLRLL